MPIWQRKRVRQKFAPFDRAALPDAPQPTFDEMLAEGVLVAEFAGRLALKNRLIVIALRGDEPFDAERAAAAAREVLYELVQEADEVAERTARERERAALRKGRSSHQHDYHQADAPNLRRREQVYAAVAKELGERCNDPEYLAAFAERAREEAWQDVAGAIDARLEREWGAWPEIEVDAAYERERGKRMREVALDLKQDLRIAAAERRQRPEDADAFRGFVG